jgi:transposase-like protein
MGKHQKTWNQAEKLAIVNFYKEHGAGKTSKAYNVSTGTIYRWVKLFQDQGSVGLSDNFSLYKDKEIARLKREIQAFKEIVAEKELELRIKDSLLKKKTLELKTD